MCGCRTPRAGSPCGTRQRRPPRQALSVMEGHHTEKEGFRGGKAVGESTGARWRRMGARRPRVASWHGTAAAHHAPALAVRHDDLEHPEDEHAPNGGNECNGRHATSGQAAAHVDCGVAARGWSVLHEAARRLRARHQPRSAGPHAGNEGRPHALVEKRGWASGSGSGFSRMGRFFPFAPP